MAIKPEDAPKKVHQKRSVLRMLHYSWTVGLCEEKETIESNLQLLRQFLSLIAQLHDRRTHLLVVSEGAAPNVSFFFRKEAPNVSVSGQCLSIS